MSDNWRVLSETQRAINALAGGADGILIPEHVAALKEFLHVYGPLTSHDDLRRYCEALIASHEHLRTERVLVQLINNED